MSHAVSEATIDEWKARGADRFDPVRFRFIEALARRASAHQGAVREALDARIAALLAAYLAAYLADSGKDVEMARPSTVPPDASARSALAPLLDHLARHAPEAQGSRELKSLGHFRRLWSRLSAERRLTQSLATVPKNAGPLNSQQLLHRSLTLMRELSPQYLERFMSHVDTLLWLDQVNRGVPAGKEVLRSAKRPARK